MRKLLTILIPVFILTACIQYSPTYVVVTATPEKIIVDSSKEAGNKLIELSYDYLSLGKSINSLIINGEYETAKVLLADATDYIEILDSISVPSKYANAKKYLRSAIWLDSFSYLMIIQGMPKEDYEETTYDAMTSLYNFVEEMNKLGHDIKF